MVLAAITLKIGAYGFLRFVLPILPDAARELSGVMVALSLVAVVYIGLVALVQSDMKSWWLTRRFRTWASSPWACSCSPVPS